MDTPLEVIKKAMRSLVKLDPGDDPETSEQTDFLDALNMMLNSWSARRWLSDIERSRSYTWPASTSSRTLGPGSLDFVQVRPVKIKGGFFRDSANQDHYFDMIPKERYDAISSKGTAGIPYQLYAAKDRAGWTLYPNLVPSTSMTVFLNTQEPVTAYLIGDVFDMPVETHQAIWSNLALNIAPELGVEPATWIKVLAQDELRMLKGLGSTPAPVVAVARELQSGSCYNIEEG